MTLYDVSSYAVQVARSLIVCIGAVSFIRILRADYRPGDFTRFILGLCMLLALNSFYWRVKLGLINFGEIGDWPLILSNTLHTGVICLVGYAVVREARAFR